MNSIKPKKSINSKTILVDFDGTVVTHEYPRVGGDVDNAVKVLKELVSKGHKLIIFTMRDDKPNHERKHLTDAVNWYKSHGIPLYGVQTNPTQTNWTSSPKAYGNLIIDDIGAMMPLRNQNGHAVVDWFVLEEWLRKTKIL